MGAIKPPAAVFCASQGMRVSAALVLNPITSHDTIVRNVCPNS